MRAISRKALRRSALELRDTLSEEALQEKSSSATRNLLSLASVRKAEVIFVYMHFRSEVRTREFIEGCLLASKVIAVPVTLPEVSQIKAVQITDPENDVEPGYCLIPEPKNDIIDDKTVDPGQIDIVVVPGSVFDAQGGRLGYGGGFYDRFLSERAPRAIRIGLAYELQMTDEVPTESHDQFMDYVVTEKKIYTCKGGQREKDSNLP